MYIDKKVITGKRFTLGGQERVKSRKLTEVLFKESNSFQLYPFKVMYRLQYEGLAGIQAGFAVGIRNFKKATDRNFTKRLMRETYRIQKLALQATLQSKAKMMIVFFVYTGKELPTYLSMLAKMQLVIKKLEELVNENFAAHS